MGRQVESACINLCVAELYNSIQQLRWGGGLLKVFGTCSPAVNIPRPFLLYGDFSIPLVLIRKGSDYCVYPAIHQHQLTTRAAEALGVFPAGPGQAGWGE